MSLLRGWGGAGRLHRADMLERGDTSKRHRLPMSMLMLWFHDLLLNQLQLSIGG